MRPILSCRLIYTILPAAMVVTLCPAAIAQPGRQRVYAYASVGDNQWVSDWPPIDSPATVEALFEWLSKTYAVKRMYWRGEQDRMWIQQYMFRPEIPLYYDYWTSWQRYLSERVKTDDLAIAAAHRRGMQIYIFDGLFEHSAQGDAGGCGMFPYQCEDKLRVEHPEWCPVDRWGERVAPGPIEFCYAGARKALVSRYVNSVTKYGYDGISFYTYVENMGVRYLDEFGFNEPIVQEFKRRYGVDIRSQPFDREAWYKLRGEYLTQFLKELHTALAAKGKKLSITIRPDKPNYPQRWYGTGVDMPGAGMVYMDWERWAKEGVVDELFIWHGGGGSALANQMIEVCKGKPVELVQFSSSPFHESWKPFVEAGITPCTVAAPGYGIDPITLDAASLATLKSPDWRLRVQTLVEIGAGRLKTDNMTVASAARDPHVLVRREVMRTLAALKAEDQVSILEAGLKDGESSVRIAAATALTKVNGPETPRRIVSALQKDSMFQMKEACIVSLAEMKEGALPVLVEGKRSPSQPIREVCVRAIGRNGLAESRELLLSVLRNDKDYRLRYYAISGLAGHREPETIEALLTALGDPTPTVQLWAAKTLGDMKPAMSADQSRQTLDALLRLFRQYGDGCKRPDGDWGWRVVGNAIMAFGDPGKEALESLRTQKKDKWAAWAAYQVVHVPQLAEKVVLCEEKDALETHARFAPAFPGFRR
ncbi:MAG: HEAT repeat domain-containing protein [Armatimonadetes bacterium]|nr:HEAT repeat domain-containing protein [Armatimonadota bacterium]